LVDTAAGETLPPGLAPLAPTTRAQVDAMRRATPEQAATLVSRANVSQTRAGSGETPIIAPEGHFTEDHGFTLSRLDLEAGNALPAAAVEGVEIIFIHSGSLAVSWAEAQVTLGEGDTMTIPTGLTRTLSTAIGAIAFIVRGPAGT
jgi:mannose-6-phosphate isomerase-like protein (cupin superfamily)